MTGNWAIPAIATFIFWGLMVFLPKLTVGHIPPSSAIIYEVLGGVTVALITLASLKFHPEFDVRGALLSYFVGIVGFLGTLAYFYAVSKGPVAIVSVITGLYPAIAVLLGIVFLHEPLTWRQGLGCLMALGGVALLSH
ncbi:MAG: EamA family transporter [Alphaproteobacteria bacterium]|nr:EamA family transporter [Alphaproteobacteria bacterium]